MRIKIIAKSKFNTFIPFNYQYVLHSAIYDLIKKSSKDYSTFLHDTGFINENKNRFFKLFTFSKIKFSPYFVDQNGFSKVKKIEFIFSTPVEKSLEHFVKGIFVNQALMLKFFGKKNYFEVTHVESIIDPEFQNQERFICLSPIAVSTLIDNRKGELVPHFLNYMIPDEREHFKQNIKHNLINKYEILKKRQYKQFDDEHDFKFNFDIDYIVRKNNKITKLIEFKNGIKIQAIEAPFTINADPELIKIGYKCGFGEKNSSGFGCVAQIA